jgi:tetratricopeptide (TPR) repeat protein/tRNA A-37 threonylcarbamoyl transferase component Bud32
MADQIKVLFLAALDTPAERRAEYLDRVCAGDTEARRRVEALLRAHEGTDPLLDRPAWQPTPVVDAAEPGRAVEPAAQAGRVVLLGEIARGGMGAVLRGHDPELGRELAVKVILPEHHRNPNLLRRFVGEARLAGQLQHPGIAPVYDVGQLSDGRPFFTMKLIQGRTLAALLLERPNPGHDLPRFLRYFEAVCQAVGYAHAQSVIHRDLKPDNVMVGAFGEVQVMDWGLAKRVGEAPEGSPEQASAAPASPSSTPLPAAFTRPGDVVGTPGYLAPEQARGRPGDPRADVFSLGAMLCEILTGAPPFRRVGPFGLLQQAREADLADSVDRLDRSGAEIELVGLAKDCLAADPADRPADGSAVAARLAEYLAGVQKRLRRAELGQARAEARAEGERTRRRLAMGLAAAVIATVALGGGTLLLVQLRRAEQDRELARRQQGAESALAQAADLRQQGRWAEALAMLEQAQQRLDDHDGPVSGEVRQAVVDLQLVARLEKIRLLAGTVSGGTFGRVRADREYEAEFRAAGLGGPGDPAETVAQRVRASGVRDALVAALDAWAMITLDPARLTWALAVAGNADPGDDWGRRIRASGADAAALEVLARDVPIDYVSPHLLATLGAPLHGREAVPFLRKAQFQYPGDFWLTFFLAMRLQEKGELVEAAGFYRAALAIRPDAGPVLVNLGILLQAQKKLDEADDCYRRAIALDPTDALSHNNLGNALRDQGRLDQAIACYRKAIEIVPNDPTPHYNLGLALKAKGQVPEAIECYRKAIEFDPKHADAYTALGIALKAAGKSDEAIESYEKAIEIDPKHALAHGNLGNALKAKGQVDQALECYRKAIELDPKDAMSHDGLGNALKLKGQVDQAIGCYRKAIAIAPDFAEGHCDLGLALVVRGDYSQALAQLRRGHELGSQRGDWKNPSDEWVRKCEQLVEREKRLLDVLAGKSEPAGARERLEWALLCLQTRRFVAATRLSGEAFAANGKLANDLEAGHRYRAALAAALAAVGQDRDAASLTTETRAALRKQAMDWLRADLDAWRVQGEASRREKALRSWRADKALAGVRDAEQLAKMPPDERVAWGALWAEVEQLSQSAR